MSTAAPAPPPAGIRPPATTWETLGQVQSLAQRIQTLLPSEPVRGNVVGVTSCSRQEGVSVVAGNLAVCASDVYQGRVLLIDANPQHACVASRFGVRRTPGLIDCLAGQSTPSDCLVETAHPDLCVLTAGASVTPPARCSDERARELFEQLRHDFALIVVDLPPAGDLDETLLATQLVDGFLLVLEAERVRRQVAQRVKRRFEQADARLLGVVLNKRKNHIPEWLYRRL